MKAMILAAGRGERMRPLTDRSPKPLLAVGGKPLIVWHIEALARAGVREIVINQAWLGRMLEEALGDGRRWGVSFAWSREGEDGLETAGGIATALPLLGDAPFLVVNGDVFTDFDLARLVPVARDLDAERCQAHLVLVPYPGHKAGAALALDAAGRVSVAVGAPYTFSGLAAYHPDFFAGVPAGQKKPLLPLFEARGASGLVRGEVLTGEWTDVGTPERLTELDDRLQAMTR
jgi:MurNAc alpha-1-phosphate uridylyltransferase